MPDTQYYKDHFAKIFADYKKMSILEIINLPKNSTKGMIKMLYEDLLAIFNEEDHDFFKKNGIDLSKKSNRKKMREIKAILDNAKEILYQEELLSLYKKFLKAFEATGQKKQIAKFGNKETLLRVKYYSKIALGYQYKEFGRYHGIAGLLLKIIAYRGFLPPRNFEKALESLSSNHPKLFSRLLLHAFYDQHDLEPFLIGYVSKKFLKFQGYKNPELIHNCALIAAFIISCTLDLPFVIFVCFKIVYYNFSFAIRKLIGQGISDEGSLGGIYNDPIRNIKMEENSGLLYIGGEERSTRKYLAAPSGDPIIAFNSAAKTESVKKYNGEIELRFCATKNQHLPGYWHIAAFDVTEKLPKYRLSEYCEYLNRMETMDIERPFYYQDALQGVIKIYLSERLFTRAPLAYFLQYCGEDEYIFQNSNNKRFLYIPRTQFVTFSEKEYRDVVEKIAESATFLLPNNNRHRPQNLLSLAHNDHNTIPGDRTERQQAF